MTRLYRNTAAMLLISLSAAPLCAAQQQTQQPSPSAVTGTRIDPAAGPQTPDTPPANAQTAPATSGQDQNQQQQPTAPATTADPTQQQQPVTTNQTAQPAAPTAEAQQSSGSANDARPAQVPQAPATQQTAPTNQEPVGAATAQRGVTRGGVASRPAGVAIAPAKQRQVRSLLIKTGAVLAAAVAVGTVYGLHKSTGSKPPGASSSTTGH